MVHLTGPSGESVKISALKKVILSEYYEKYCSRGFIRRVVASHQTQPKLAEAIPTPIQARNNISKIVQKRIVRHPQPQPKQQPPQPQAKLDRDSHIKRETIAKLRKASNSIRPQKVNQLRKMVVGRTTSVNANELLKSNLSKNHYPISNNIGVGILSYNRSRCLKRLIDSIISNTDLRKTTIFVSDDASTDPNTIDYLNQLSENPNFVVLRNTERLGVAGNSNRLLKCLSRFEFGILLNDDVEILAQNWEYLYPDIMKSTNMHHFIYRQKGVYNADLGENLKINSVEMQKVTERPHGAVLAFTNRMFEQIGFFDESYGLYGMEHVDWSQRVWEFNMQPPGFYDVVGSDHFFYLHQDESAVHERSASLQNARNIFSNRTTKKVTTSKAVVPSVSYVVPFRDHERTNSIKTVINNIRAQRFPHIEIIMVEQDNDTKIDVNAHLPAVYALVRGNKPPFNKSKAFNCGVSKATTDLIIMHDADMIAPGNYTSYVFKTLDKHDACHLGNTVIYTNQETMIAINTKGLVDETSTCDRVVGYYEGGSLACKTKTYWLVGGFNEDYWGYGCEDCDFYARLAGGSNWVEDRVFDFLHLWHSRVSGWEGHHKTNKAIEEGLKSQSIEERISLQHRQLMDFGYHEQLQQCSND